ncbi:GNAT family N-acetyltransferase [Actinoplanes sp. N902-109]|uniref:GNAT family N-acetyltransferase n=1 Tax=Actinoplanes sp. (strain N902-109) TaxID=649831 RepID=UPI0003293E88|nr:GNAT family N-acetyltransferase [Actinoplanes sp. N902-109]AGL14674.1 GCN5-like N-acetyltransferase [Actinoplanes sp. N902-109]
MNIEMRPINDGDLSLLRRFAVEPGLIGPNWYGFRDAQAEARRYAEDGFLSDDSSRVIVQADEQTAGMLSWSSGRYGRYGSHWEIGIALLPEWRGRGVGWRAQAMLCDYLFEHTPVQRIQAATQSDNIAEQKALTKAGFQREGLIRAAEFRLGQWRDGILYSRLRTDPTVDWRS